MSEYCDIALGHAWHGPYHDTEYGFPTDDEATLFERLVLEINQAGLSWLTILKKREGFVSAFEGFDVDKVASYGERDRARLLDDPSIIRNRLKVDAAIHNAGCIVAMRKNYGGFSQWLEVQHRHIKLDKEAWVKLFKNTFKFTGSEITSEFLMSIGYLPGAHREDCHVFERISALGPTWMVKG
ncbi:MAG: DNA-3-methyladenine glycosylase [Alphaproteobacteria bacterium]|nr:DNA-3-methyladenine glycosylase [Alphaproteobacteria bacterium]